MIETLPMAFEQSIKKAGYPVVAITPAPAALSAHPHGAVIINADDWGRNEETTDRTLDCIRARGVSSVSAMLFMQDAERAAAIAAENQIDVGLHLNLTTPFSAASVDKKLAGHQNRLRRYLRISPLAPAIFNPFLVNSFRYVVAAHLDEFQRLYHRQPARIDGHHHMHLCANVLWSGLLPSGTIVRRNFSFSRGEKSFVNRWYRKQIDKVLLRRYRVTDFFFSLPPLQPDSRLERIFALGLKHAVEIETHPVNADEYRFFTEGGVTSYLREVSLSSFSQYFYGDRSLAVQ